MALLGYSLLGCRGLLFPWTLSSSGNSHSTSLPPIIGRFFGTSFQQSRPLKLLHVIPDYSVSDFLGIQDFKAVKICHLGFFPPSGLSAHLVAAHFVLLSAFSQAFHMYFWWPLCENLRIMPATCMHLKGMTYLLIQVQVHQPKHCSDQ